MPFVSVVVPTHNRPEMLAEALASVRTQTFTDYEIIVVSNGESPQMRQRSQAAAALAGARYFAEEEGNLPAARNFGIARAGGEWIAFLDDDDIWLPHKLERQVAAIGASGADMISCDFVAFCPNGGEVIRRPRLPQGWTYAEACSRMLHWWAQPSCVLLSRAVFDSVGGFDTRRRVGEDVDLWRRLAWRHRFHQMDEVLVRYRVGHPRLTENRSRDRFDELRYYRKMYRDTPPDLRWVLPSKAGLLCKWFLRAVMPTWIRHPRKFFVAVVPNTRAKSRGC